MIREADEEASLPDEVVRHGAKLTGTDCLCIVTDERSGMADLIVPRSPVDIRISSYRMTTV